jgi:predicted Ser/Thr protein kinase
VSGLAQLVGTLLSVFGGIAPNICPGDFSWSVTLFGMLLAALPVIGAILVALTRKVIGNRYGTGSVVTFGVLGLGLGFLLPWLLLESAARVFNLAAANFALGLGRSDVVALHQPLCHFQRFGTQADYLGSGTSAYQALTGSGSVATVWYGVVLAGVPLLSLLMVWFQQRVALRRGPGWPGRLMWLSVLGLILFTAPLPANVVAQFWLGFFPASLVGIIVVALFGTPSWSTLNQQARPAGPGRMPPPPVRPQQSQYVPPPSYRPEPQPLPQTRVAALPPAPPPTRAALPPAPAPRSAAELANTPGPLPFGGPEPTDDLEGPTVAWNKVNSRFRRVRQLGTGGFGTVWLAMDTQLDRTVALKLAHAPDAETQARMLREARALAAVHHPNCVRVYDIAEDAEGLGIVMEYIEGHDLAETVKGEGVLDDVAAARLWVTMAGALGDAHAKGVLHRDVKPANVLLDRSGIAHLIDFGIARSQGDVTLTAAGMMMGTPDFLAPETASTGLATPASDAWQLAATVSYALTGQPPRGRRSNPMSALMAAAQQLPITHLPERSAHSAILRAALDADPSRRPTLTTVQREVGNWLATAGLDSDGPVTTVVHRRTIAGADRR